MEIFRGKSVGLHFLEKHTGALTVLSISVSLTHMILNTISFE